MKKKKLVVRAIIMLLLIIALVVVTAGCAGTPEPKVPKGEFEIVAKIDIGAKYFLLALRSIGTTHKPKYYSIAVEQIINPEDIDTATQLIKKEGTDFEYIILK